MNDEDEDIRKSSSPLPQSSNMTTSSSTQQPISFNETGDSKVQKTPTVYEEDTSDSPTKKSIWLVAWIRNQIKVFNPLLLLMAMKFVFPPRVV